MVATAAVGWATTAVATTHHHHDATAKLEAASAETASETNKKKRKQQSLVSDKTHPHTLFVWDFDWTVINCNSDEYIPGQFMSKEELRTGFRDLYKSTKGDWHACVEGMVSRAMDKKDNKRQEEDGGATQEQIIQAAQQMPYLIPVKQTIQKIHACTDTLSNPKNIKKTSQMILSDGNTVFIGAFLYRQGLMEHFDAGVISNFGIWATEIGDTHTKRCCLKVIHQSKQYGGHNCDYGCSANLCKSQALTNTLTEKGLQVLGSRTCRIVYIGDGGNDACPVLNVLQQGDIMLARSGNRPICANERQGGETDQEANCDEQEGSPFGILPALEKAKLNKDPPMIPKCQVLQWQTGQDLQKLVDEILEDVR